MHSDKSCGVGDVFPDLKCGEGGQNLVIFCGDPSPLEP